MSTHYLRWLQTIHSITSSLAFAVLHDKQLSAYEDVADQLELLAKNIRQRAASQPVLERGGKL